MAITKTGHKSIAQNTHGTSCGTKSHFVLGGLFAPLQLRDIEARVICLVHCILV